MTEPTAERWARVQTIFEHAADLVGGDRTAYLDAECAEDADLRREVDELLAAEAEVDGFLEGAAASPIEDDHVVVPRYDVGACIGAGGMGVVYRAQRTGDFEQIVAVKVLKRGMDTDNIVRRFRLERQTLANLSHPNIAQVFDGGRTTDGRPYLVMELVTGRPIDAYCREVGLDVQGRIELFRKVCDAVAHAHRNLIVHRDIKPSNVLVDERGEPKLLDFGVAKVLDPSVAGQSLAVTATGERLLTPRYASPEQIRGEAITTATDVYALGVVLYELLAGRSPYDLEASASSIERMVCDTDPARPSTAVAPDDETSAEDTRRLRRALRGDLDLIVLKALRKEPERRYASVEALHEDLRRWLAREPVRARPPSVGYRLRTFARRRRAALVAASGTATIGAIIATLLVVTLVLMPRWSADALRQARATVLGPEQQAELYNQVFFRGHERAVTSNAGYAADAIRDLDALGRAETLYDRSVRFAPFADELRRERDAIRAGRLLRLTPREAPVPPEVLALVDPAVASLLAADTPSLEGVPPQVLREFGLVLLLGRPSNTVIETLRTYEAVADPDPLVEGLLGELYLAIGHPALAYPRCRAAHDAYPESRALTLALAEAAAGVGDSGRAMRLVEQAARLPHADHTARIDRVRALALAASGRMDEAERLLVKAAESTNNPVTDYRCARHLDASGDLEAAVRWYARSVRWPVGEPGDHAVMIAMADFVDGMERWVGGWSPEERAERLASLSHPAPVIEVHPRYGFLQPTALRGSLALYAAVRQELVRRPTRVAVFPEEAERFAAERRGWSEPNEVSRLAGQLPDHP